VLQANGSLSSFCSCAFFKQNPAQKHAQLVIGGTVKQAISFTRETTVEDHNLLIPERQALELVLSEVCAFAIIYSKKMCFVLHCPETGCTVWKWACHKYTHSIARTAPLPMSPPLCVFVHSLLQQEPEVVFPCVDQYGNAGALRAWLYHPFLDAVKRMCEDAEVVYNSSSGEGGGGLGGSSSNSSSSSNNSTCPLSPQQPVLDVDLYHSSDVSLISLQNSPAACGLQGGEPLLLYRYGRCSREYWQQHDQPERAAKPSFVGIYFSDYKNQVHSRGSTLGSAQGAGMERVLE
jgi:hypothetical protein